MVEPDLPPPPDRRRLHRDVEYKHPTAGVYSTSDSMHAVKKDGARSWKRGVRQPYNLDGDYDFSKPETYKRLRDAQSTVEAGEAELPRSALMRTPFNDRRAK